MNRHLEWEGCFNARDLGGLRTLAGLVIRRGAAVRADAPSRLTASGWSALWAYGVRTIIDLRNDDELVPDAAPRPDGVTTVHLPLDGMEDREFWDYWSSGPQFGTPLYFRPHLERFPHLSANVIAAIAQSPPGGVLLHCGRGRDRTGLITMQLLDVVGVPAEDIAADYALSTDRLRQLFDHLGEEDQGPSIAGFLESLGTSPCDAMLAAVDGFDAAAHLRKAGLSSDDLAALRRRLLDPE